MHHVSMVVDTGSSRYQDVSSVAIFHTRSSLEGHSILVGGIEVCGSIQVTLLPRTKSYDGIGPHLYECVCIGRQSAYACTGYVVGMLGEPLLGKVVPACLHHASILGIHISHEEPCAHTVVGQSGSHVVQGMFVFPQDILGLLCAVALGAVHPHPP